MGSRQMRLAGVNQRSLELQVPLEWKCFHSAPHALEVASVVLDVASEVVWRALKGTGSRYDNLQVFVSQLFIERRSRCNKQLCEQVLFTI